MNDTPHQSRSLRGLALAALAVASAASLTPDGWSAEATGAGSAPATLVAPTGLPPTPAGTRLVADRLSVELPAAPAPTAPTASPRADTAGAPGGLAAADPAVVALELGVEAPETTPGILAPDSPGEAAGVKTGALEYTKKHPTTGIVSVGVGSNDSYHVGVGVTTQLTPRTSLSAGVTTGRWDEGWGWWSRDPFPPYRSFPELQP